MVLLIDPTKQYTMKEVLEKNLIPGVTGYTALYNLITEKVPCSSNEMRVKRVPAKETTKFKIKAVDDGHPWNVISGKKSIKGMDIIKFLQINKLITL